jgi:hypothetical protein
VLVTWLRAGAPLALCLGWLLAVGCSGDSDSNAEADAGVETFCPPADHPRVHYVGMQGSECAKVELACTSEQTAFDNTCGCGCVDKGDAICPDLFDPAITWVSHDPAACGTADPPCPLGDTPFNNTCGCGCIQH